MAELIAVSADLNKEFEEGRQNLEFLLFSSTDGSHLDENLDDG